MLFSYTYTYKITYKIKSREQLQADSTKLVSPLVVMTSDYLGILLLCI